MMPWLRRAAVPQGVRVYAVAPVGGRLAALDEALAVIADDAAAQGPAERRTILLGGLIEGPEASAVTLRAMRLSADPGTAILCGPDEMALLARPIADDVPASVLHWLARRPREGWVGDYRFGDGAVQAFGRPVLGIVVALEGRTRRRLI